MTIRDFKKYTEDLEKSGFVDKIIDIVVKKFHKSKRLKEFRTINGIEDKLRKIVKLLIDTIDTAEYHTSIHVQKDAVRYLFDILERYLLCTTRKNFIFLTRIDGIEHNVFIHEGGKCELFCNSIKNIQKQLSFSGYKENVFLSSLNTKFCKILFVDNDDNLKNLHEFDTNNKYRLLSDVRNMFLICLSGVAPSENIVETHKLVEELCKRNDMVDKCTCGTHIGFSNSSLKCLCDNHR